MGLTCSHPSRPGAGRSGSFPSAGLKPRNFNRRLEPAPCIYSLQSFSGRREQRIMGTQELQRERSLREEGGRVGE